MKDSTLLLLIGGGVFLLAGGTAVVISKMRGVRNNNPGNIEKGIAWKGLATAQPDSRFATFAHPKWGFRAMARIILGDFKEGQNTVRSLIEEWSPQADKTNPAGSTANYVNAVARALNVAPDAPINVPAKLPVLLDAMARHENGGYRFNPADIAAGITLERTA